MSEFATPNDLAQSFVKSYYPKAVYEVDQLHNFYSADAVISRQGVVSTPRMDITATRILSFNLASDAFLTVGNYTAIAQSDIVSLTVTGTIESEGDMSHFTQAFLIQPMNGKQWVTQDVLVIFDEEYIRDLTASRGSRVPDPSAASTGRERPPPPARGVPQAGKKGGKPPERKGGKKKGRKGKRGGDDGETE
jgi:hypothetical protein